MWCVSAGFKAATVKKDITYATNWLYCSRTYIYLRVYTEADIYKRLNWTNTTSVHMAIHNDLVLQSSWIVGPEFACTTIEGRPQNQSTAVSITTTSFVYPPLLVQYTANVLIVDITLKWATTAGPYSGSSLCPYLSDMQSWTYNCPTIQIWNAYHIKMYNVSLKAFFPSQGILPIQSF